VGGSARSSKAWTIRGTLHLHPAEELSLWHAARRAVAGRADRGLPSWRDPAGAVHPALDADEVEAVRAAVWEVLDGRCLLREELTQEVVKRVGAAPLERLRSGFAFFLGELCQGPPQGSRITLVRPDQWIDGWRRLDDEARRCGRSCRRFLRAYGPARPADFSEWFSSAAFKAAEARGLFDELAGDLEEISVDGRHCFVLAGDRSFPAPDQRGAAAAGVRRLRDGISRARSARAARRFRELIAGHGRGRYEVPPGCASSSSTGSRPGSGSAGRAADGSSSGFGSCGASGGLGAPSSSAKESVSARSSGSNLCSASA